MRSLGYLVLLLAMTPLSVAAQGQAGPGQAGVGQTAAGYTVDFNDQDVRVVFSALAEAAGANVTFGALPDIRTTLHLGQPVPKEQLLDVMRSIAEQNGLTMTTDGSLVRIARAREQRFGQRETMRPKV